MRLCATAILLAAACTSATGTPPSPSPVEFNLTISEATRSFQSCSPNRIVNLIEELFAAYNEADLDRAASFVSPGTQWFTFTRAPDRGGHRDFGSPSLMRVYVANRHRHGERLTLTELNLNGAGGGAGPDAMNVGYRFAWSADDGAGLGHGKGAIDCDGHILAWSMGESGLPAGAQ